MRCFATVVAAAVLAGAAEGSIGDRMTRTANKYTETPITLAKAEQEGWVPVSDECTEGLGWGYMNVDPKLAATQLYFDAAGKLSGTSVDTFGTTPPQKLVTLGYWVKVEDETDDDNRTRSQQPRVNQYRISLGYRDPFTVCDEDAVHEGPIGDRLVVNPSTLNQTLPITSAAATGEGWFKGSCFYGMGTHYFYDLAASPSMSWKAENVLPVVLMFAQDGGLQGTIFTSTSAQVDVFDTADWDPFVLSNQYMCYNTCSSECHWEGTSAWNLYHFYYKALSNAVCYDGCTFGCCPAP